MTRPGIAQLTEGQRVCLRMVYRHMSSKDIARELKISPHTVDQRVRFAIQRLGVSSRIEAAKLLTAHEASKSYQPNVYQASDIAPIAEPAQQESALECAELSPDLAEHRVGGMEQRLFPIKHPSLQQRSKWPFPLVDGERNELNIVERLGWITAIAIGAALAFGMILAGMDALSRLV